MIEEETCFGEQGGATHPMAEEVDYVVMLAGMGSSAANDAGGIRARPVEQMGHVGATSNHVAMAETGDVSLTADWLTVSLNNYYFKPVVIAGSPTANGGDTATVRVRNVRHGQGCAGWCFDIKIQEPPCLDGPHPNARRKDETPTGGGEKGKQYGTRGPNQQRAGRANKMDPGKGTRH